MLSTQQFGAHRGSSAASGGKTVKQSEDYLGKGKHEMRTARESYMRRKENSSRASKDPNKGGHGEYS